MVLYYLSIVYVCMDIYIYYVYVCVHIRNDLIHVIKSGSKHDLSMNKHETSSRFRSSLGENDAKAKPHTPGLEVYPAHLKGSEARTGRLQWVES